MVNPQEFYGQEQPPDLSEFNTGYLDVLDASYEAQKLQTITSQSIYTGGIGGIFGKIGGIQDPFTGQAKLPFEEAKKRILESGYDIRVPEDGFTGGQLQTLIDRRKKLDFYNSVIQRGELGSSVMSLAGAVGASFLDPIEAAISFAPVPGFSAKMAMRLKNTVNPLSRAMMRAQIGAAEGAFGQILLEPMMHYYSDYTGDEYTMADTLLNVGAGSVLGAGLHSAGGAFFDVIQRKTGKVPGMKAYAELDPEWKQRIPAVKKIADEYKADIPDIQKERFNRAYKILEKEGIQDAEFVVAMSEIMDVVKHIPGTTVEKFKQSLPSGLSGINADGTISRVLFEPGVRDLLWDNLDDFTKEVIRDLPEDFSPGDVVPVFEGVDATEIASFTKKYSRGDNLENVLNRMEADDPTILTRATRAAQSLEEGLEEGVETPFERINKLTPEQRYNLYNYASEQIRQGIDFDVTPVLDLVEGKIGKQEYIERVKNMNNTPEYRAQSEKIKREVGSSKYNEMTEKTLIEDSDSVEAEIRRIGGLEQKEPAPEGPTVKPEPKKVKLEIKDEPEVKQVRDPKQPERLSTEAVDAAKARFEKLIDTAFDGIEIQFGRGRGQGAFDAKKKIITLFEDGLKTGKIENTLIHEVWHSLAQFLPEEDVLAMRRAFNIERAKYEAQNPQFKFFEGKKRLTGKKAEEFQKAFPNYQDMPDIRATAKTVELIHTPENYRYTSLDEFFAETMKDLTFDRYRLEDEAAQSVWGAVKKIWTSIVRSTRQALGKDEAGRIFSNYLRGAYGERVRGALDDGAVLHMATEERVDIIDLSTPEGVQQKLDEINAALTTGLDTAKALNLLKENYGNKEAFISKAIGETPTLSPEELGQIYDFIEKDVATAKQKTGDPVQESIDVFATLLKTNALTNKREALYNLKARLTQKNKINSFSLKDLYDGFISILTGTYKQGADGRNIYGGRVSIQASQRAESRALLGNLVSFLRDNDLVKVFELKENSEPLFRVMYHLANDEPIPRGIYSDELVQIANKVFEVQEFSRLRANEKGAWISKLDGRVVGQSYDLLKVRKNATAFKRLLAEGWDFERSFDFEVSPKEREEIINETAKRIISGVHVKDGEANPSLFTLPGIGKKLSQHRKIHWKNVDYAYQAMKEYGRADNTAQAIFGELDRIGQSIGILEHLGPAHRQNLRMIAEQKLIELRNLETEEAYKAIDWLSGEMRQKGRITSIMDFLDGSDNIPADNMIAQIGSIVRQLTTMSKFGSVVVSQFSDIAMGGSEARSSFGMGFAESYWLGVENIINTFRGDRRRRVAEGIGILSDSMIGRVLSRIDNPEVPGMMSDAMQKYMKFNLMQYWTDAQRVGYGLAFAKELAHETANFKAMRPEIKRLLKEYDISASEWQKAQANGIDKIEGYNYLSPQKLEAYNYDLAQKVRTLLLDRVMTAAMEPDARTRSKFRAAPKGGGMREIMDTLLQFKTFAMGLYNQVYRRSIERGESAMLAEMFFMATVFGIVSYQVKEFLKNKTFVDARKHPMKVLLAGASKGGGLGIFGDFLFGEYNRMGSGVSSTLLGPTMGTGAAWIELFLKAREGKATSADMMKHTLNSSAFVGAGIGSTFGPAGTAYGALSGGMVNHFMVRPLVNQAFVYPFQDAVDPGYFNKMKKNMMKEKGQEYVIDPLIFRQ